MSQIAFGAFSQEQRMNTRDFLHPAWAVLPAALVIFACAPQPSPLDTDLPSFSADRLMSHIEVLASDEFEGRAPGSRGEELTLAYLERQFREIGLEPGNPNGTYLQEVPLVGITAHPEMTLRLSRGGRTMEGRYGEDFVAWTKRVVESSAVDGEMVFVGYGVQAPEFDWDDFKGTDVKGKVIVVLINDPPVVDEPIFGGNAMTYYGRWTYKFEKAAELGAAGAFIIHETGPAGYPWSVVEGSWTGEQFDLASAHGNMGRVAIEGWITRERADELFRLAGSDLEELKAAAARRDFRPVALGVRAQVSLQNQLRTVDSHNAIAKLPGSDPLLRDQYVLYCAHWDHLGKVEEDGETKIFNGAKDNASGTAALLETARAFAELAPAPRRSLLFLAVTAEEQGLLGSRHYAENPLHPLHRTAAVINLDGMNVLGPTRDMVVVGIGQTTLDDVAAAVAGERGRTLRPDPEPEKGYFYRSDHFSFARHGVPAFYPNEGIDYIGRSPEWGEEMRAKYTAEDYHSPSDTIKDYWDLTGLAEDVGFLFEMGLRVANDDEMPVWRPGTEFLAAREESLRRGDR
jgi:Zn-dependent M28 family amino/carboxypeptidase